MPSSRSPSRLSVMFDDDHAVADAGLALVGVLSEKLGLEVIAEELVDVHLCMPKTSSGPIGLDFCCRDTDDEDGTWHSPSSTSPFVGSLQLVRLSWGEQQDLAIEVVMVRHEVAVLRRQVARPALRPVDRGVLAGLSRLLSPARRGRFLVQPETLLRWHRDLMRRKWTYSQRRPGRPSIPVGTVSVILRLAKENPMWGYRRIHGELATMGVRLAPSSVWAILRRHGIESSPRRAGPSWAELLRVQATTMLACDFFTSTRCCSGATTCCSSSRSTPVWSSFQASPPTQ